MQVDPTRGLYSETAFRQGILLQDQFLGGVAGIVQGRQSVRALDDLVPAWRRGGGEAMRTEFQEALQNSSR
jgi:putative aldouronate transport system substrate-binding protein